SRRTLGLGFAVSACLASTARGQDPLPIYPENYKVYLENDRVRVLDFRLKRGAKEESHAHPAHVVYVLTGFKIRFTLPDGRTVIRTTASGDVLFSEAITHASENIGDTDAHGILMELKTPAARAGRAASAESAPADLLTAVTFIRGMAGKETEVKRELLALTAPTRAEPGALRYDLYQSVDRPDDFMRIEVWRSREALEAHKLTPHLRASFERRKDQGWKTEITRWRRVPEEAGEELAAFGR
ncbi:MAG: antibiotic biosynthesis monooxygenase, partial [Gammaproteobacteria bacterium]